MCDLASCRHGADTEVKRLRRALERAADDLDWLARHEFGSIVEAIREAERRARDALDGGAA